MSQGFHGYQCVAQLQLHIEQWEQVLPLVLHSQKSFLHNVKNATPCEQLFSFPRKSSYGISLLPTILSSPGPGFLRRHVQRYKYEPLVDEGKLLHANPNYSHVIRWKRIYSIHLAPRDYYLMISRNPTVTDCIYLFICLPSVYV